MAPVPTNGSRYGKGRSRVLRILLVDDDPALRTLLRTTFELADVDVVEAHSADAARKRIRAARPDVIVLDVNMPRTTGLELCAELKADPRTSDIPVILLTGSSGGTSAAAKRAGADAFVRKPFSPPELLAVAERLAGGPYGVLLHDVGKIGIPDGILLKPGPLSAAERRRMQTHTVLGEAMLSGVAFLKGEGLRIVRSHHERWDGRGYPDGLSADEIPLGARIFAVADSLDAMTSNRPYRRAMSWQAARTEILDQRKRQFDPEVVDAFVSAEAKLKIIRRELAAA